MIFQILRQGFAAVEQFLPLGMGDIPAHNDGAGEQYPGGNRMSAQLGKNLLHGLVQVNGNSLAVFTLTQRIRDQASGIIIKLLQPESLSVDPGLEVAIGRA